MRVLLVKRRKAALCGMMERGRELASRWPNTDSSEQDGHYNSQSLP